MDIIRDCTVPRIKPSTVGTQHFAAAQPANPTATAAYVAIMSGELAALARRQKLDTLGYLLDLVRLEAEDTAKR